MANQKKLETTGNKDRIGLLFLGGGKRVSLGSFFQQAGNRLGKEVELFSYDESLQQPFSRIGKVIEGRNWQDPLLVEDIKAVVSRFEIDIILGNVDPVLPILSSLRLKLPAASYCSSPEITTRCYSKAKFQDLCEAKNLPIIPRWDGSAFPFVAKPDFGSASQGIQIFRTPDDFERDKAHKNQDHLFQKFVSGPEFSVDAYVTREGRIVGISPRRRLTVVGGEVLASKTVVDESLVEITKNAIGKIGLIGPLNVQFIWDPQLREYQLLEVNSRFGGGVINSIGAGVDFPRMVLEDFLGLYSEAVICTREVVMKRYFSEVFF